MKIKQLTRPSNVAKSHRKIFLFFAELEFANKNESELRVCEREVDRYLDHRILCQIRLPFAGKNLHPHSWRKSNRFVYEKLF